MQFSSVGFRFSIVKRPTGVMENTAIDLPVPSPARDEPPLDAAEERALVSALAAGDRGASEILARRTYRLVFTSLFKLCGDPDLAADLTQETYQQAWRALDGFDGRARFSTWLYRIAYNAFVSHLRRPRLLTPLADDPSAAAPSSEESQHQKLERCESSERLRRALLTLPETLRLTVTARFWGELPVAEIARLEGVSSTAIRKRLRRAEKLLRQELSGQEPSHQAREEDR